MSKKFLYEPTGGHQVAIWRDNATEWWVWHCQDCPEIGYHELEDFSEREARLHIRTSATSKASVPAMDRELEAQLSPKTRQLLMERFEPEPEVIDAGAKAHRHLQHYRACGCLGEQAYCCDLKCCPHEVRTGKDIQSHGYYAWECTTCGAYEGDYLSLVYAEADGREHEQWMNAVTTLKGTRCRTCGAAIQQVTAGNGYTYWSHVRAGPACGGKYKAGSAVATP